MNDNVRFIAYEKINKKKKEDFSYNLEALNLLLQDNLMTKSNLIYLKQLKLVTN